MKNIVLNKTMEIELNIEEIKLIYDIATIVLDINPEEIDEEEISKIKKMKNECEEFMNDFYD